MGAIRAAWAWSTSALSAMTSSLLATKEGKKLKEARVELEVGQAGAALPGARAVGCRR